MLINIYLISTWGEPAEHKGRKPDLGQDRSLRMVGDFKTSHAHKHHTKN